MGAGPTTLQLLAGYGMLQSASDMKGLSFEEPTQTGTLTGSGQGSVASSCEHSSEPSGPIKCGGLH